MIENWEDAAFETDGRVTTFRTEHLEITFTGTLRGAECRSKSPSSKKVIGLF